MSLPPPGAPNNNKRAIPRLPSHPNPNRYGVMSRQRVPRACYACRARKIKCNGDQPACQSCREHAIACSYAPARKDRVKQLTESNERLVRLLKDLRSQVGDARSKEIDQLLQDAADEANDAMAIQDGPASNHSKSLFVADDERGEAAVSAEVGSSHEVDITIDITGEDLLETEQSRATGFIGRNSEIQVMRRLHHLADNPKMDAVTGPYGPPGMGDQAAAARFEAAPSRKSSDNSVPTRPANSYNFYMDDENVELDIIVDPSELPPYETAKKLLDCYMTSVHNSFPILDKLSLYNRFNEYYASLGSGAPQTLSERSLAVFNLVFAIGAVFSHLAESDWRGDARDHTVYQSRAWSLVFKDPWWYPHPDLSQLQLTGLLSFYYLTIGHVNRSWFLSGIAIRSGQAMGLHVAVRNEDPAVTPVQKEMRSRIWWAVYSLETMVCTITGRPSAGVEHHCSVPLPLPLAAEELEEPTITSLLEERQRNMRKDSLSRVGATTKLAPIHEPTNCGTYLKALVTVNMINQAALRDLYSATTVNKSWETIQRNVTHLLGRLDAWASSVPPGLDFMSPKAAVQEEFGQERMVLAYNYFSSKILITRPCLYRIDRHVPSQSNSTDGFNKRMSEACVEAAASIAGLLPDDADQIGIRAYHVRPWWSMVHFLMQAVTTLLLDIFSITTQISPGRHEKMACLKKILRCLRVMSSANASAGRAYNVAFNILQILAAKTDSAVDISDLQSSHNAYYSLPVSLSPGSLSPFSHQNTANPGNPGNPGNANLSTNPATAAAAFEPLPHPMQFHHPQHHSPPSNFNIYPSLQQLAADFDLTTWAQGTAPMGATGPLNTFPAPANAFANVPAGIGMHSGVGSAAAAAVAGGIATGATGPPSMAGGMYVPDGYDASFQFWGPQSQN